MTFTEKTRRGGTISQNLLVSLSSMVIANTRSAVATPISVFLVAQPRMDRISVTREEEDANVNVQVAHTASKSQNSVRQQNLHIHGTGGTERGTTN